MGTRGNPMLYLYVCVYRRPEVTQCYFYVYVSVLEPEVTQCYIYKYVYGGPEVIQYYIYSETSLNQTLRKLVLLNIGRFFKSISNNSLQKKSHKTGHPSKPTIFSCPSVDRYKEVSLYMHVSVGGQR